MAQTEMIKEVNGKRIRLFKYHANWDKDIHYVVTIQPQNDWHYFRLKKDAVSYFENQ